MKGNDLDMVKRAKKKKNIKKTRSAEFLKPIEAEFPKITDRKKLHDQDKKKIKKNPMLKNVQCFI